MSLSPKAFNDILNDTSNKDGKKLPPLPLPSQRGNSQARNRVRAAKMVV